MSWMLTVYLLPRRMLLINVVPTVTTRDVWQRGSSASPPPLHWEASAKIKVLPSSNQFLINAILCDLADVSPTGPATKAADCWGTDWFVCAPVKELSGGTTFRGRRLLVRCFAVFPLKCLRCANNVNVWCVLPVIDVSERISNNCCEFSKRLHDALFISEPGTWRKQDSQHKCYTSSPYRPQ